MADMPHIFRPIPRRPFDLNRRDPTPPPESDSPGPVSGYPNLNIQTPSRSSGPGLTPSSTFDSSTTNDSDATTMSRAASFLNLQKSTLFGIYQSSSQPSSPTPDETSTAPGASSPWGTGAETPLLKRPGVSDAMFEIMRSRRSGDASEQLDHNVAVDSSHPPPQPLWDAVGVFFRVAVLFGLGVGYGVLVGRLRSDAFNPAAAAAAGTRRESAAAIGWQHSLFWGVGGVAIAALLPWFDGVWEDKFGGGAASRRLRLRRKSNDDERRPPMDWSLVLRAITAFLGIVFAIRKLAWTSTMQVSLYLAVVNPFLWYLLDRSKTGFLLSAAFSCTAAAALMGLDPDLMPIPTMRGGSPLRNATRAAAAAAHDRDGGVATAAAAAQGAVLPCSVETVERALWIVSVLFCSCLIFGNIGRRMGLDRSAYTRGRWAGVR